MGNNFFHGLSTILNLTRNGSNVHLVIVMMLKEEQASLSLGLEKEFVLILCWVLGYFCHPGSSLLLAKMKRDKVQNQSNI